MESAWINPEVSLLELYKLPHNIFGLTNNLERDELFISQKKIQDISRFVGERARKKDYCGARLFIRADYAGQQDSDNNWWLDAESILALYERHDALQNRDISLYIDEVVASCHEYFAEFGKIHRISTLCLPQGESIIGLSQPPLSEGLTAYLSACLEKIYFPITNPEWIRHHGHF